MLVLTRKADEEIIINGNIRIKVVSILDGKIKLGISAPADVEILRGEIYESVKESALEASQKSGQKLDNLNKMKIHKIEK